VNLIASVAESTSMAQVLRRLGLRAAGGNYEQVKAIIKTLKLDTQHWKAFCAVAPSIRATS
jgi:hypothetical protein